MDPRKISSLLSIDQALARVRRFVAETTGTTPTDEEFADALAQVRQNFCSRAYFRSKLASCTCQISDIIRPRF